MSVQVLIVGDRERAAALEQATRSFGYEAAYSADFVDVAAPAVVLAALGQVDARALMRSLRARFGAELPVVLYGRVGSARPELADILELGADRFLQVPLVGAELESALLELVGPPPREQHVTLTQQFDSSPAQDEQVRARGDASDRVELDGLEVDDDGDELLALALTEGLEVDALLPEESGETGAGAAAFEVDAEPRAASDEESAEEIVEEVFEEVAAVVLREPFAEKTAAFASTPLREPRAHEAALVDAAPHARRTMAYRTGGRPEVTPTKRASARRPGSRETLVQAADPEDHARAGASEQPTRGSLAYMGAAELLVELAEAGCTGQLELALESGAWRILDWRGGALLRARSSEADDELLRVLVSAGLLDEADVLVAARMIDDARPERSVELLARLGMIKSSERARALELHVVRCLAPALQWRAGRWTLTPSGPARDDVGLRARPMVVLRDALARGLDSDALLERIRDGRLGPLRPALASGASELELAEAFGLEGGSRAWLSRFDGASTLDELERRDDADELSRHHLRALVVALSLAGQLELRSESRVELAARELRDASAIDRARIEARLRLVQTADFFTVLGIPRDASRLEVLLAHAELSAMFSDERLEPETVAHYLDRAREAEAGSESDLHALRAGLDEARDVLLSDTMRAVYRAHLPEADPLTGGDDE